MGLWSQLLGAPNLHAQDRYVDNWLKGIEPALQSATGLTVTVAAALTVPGISGCVQVQSEDLAKVPLDLKKRAASGYEPAIDHPLYVRLKFGPAPWLPSYKWRKALVHSVMTNGNHFSRVRRSEGGSIEQINAIQLGRCTVRWTGDGEPFFDVHTATGIEKGLSWQDVIHVGYRDSHDNTVNGGVLGISPIMQNKETVALMIAAERFAAMFFGNGAQPSMVLSYDKKLPDDEVAKRIRAGIERAYSGMDNKWKVAILEMGMTMKEFGGDPVKSQLIETRKHGAEQACTMYRTPPHKIGLLDRATNNNIEHQSIDYVTGPISGLAKSVESAIEVACLTPAEREVYKVEHNLEGLLRGDILSRYRAYAIGRQWGWLSVNKILKRENENEIGPEGDEFLVPMNMAPAGDNPSSNPQQNDQNAASAEYPGEVNWQTMAFRSFNPNKLNGHAPPRLSSLVASNGDPLRIH